MRAIIVKGNINHCPDPLCSCDWRGYLVGRTVGSGYRGQDLKRRLIEAGQTAASWLYFVDTDEGRAFVERQKRVRASWAREGKR